MTILPQETSDVPTASLYEVVQSKVTQSGVPVEVKLDEGTVKITLTGIRPDKDKLQFVLGNEGIRRPANHIKGKPAEPMDDAVKRVLEEMRLHTIGHEDGKHHAEHTHHMKNYFPDNALVSMRKLHSALADYGFSMSFHHDDDDGSWSVTFSAQNQHDVPLVSARELRAQKELAKAAEYQLDEIIMEILGKYNANNGRGNRGDARFRRGVELEASQIEAVNADITARAEDLASLGFSDVAFGTPDQYGKSYLSSTFDPSKVDPAKAVMPATDYQAYSPGY
ncbi:MAG: hypothetical protein SFX19_00840 [Alphaproteobacteria bacterium]|nr:hypothetical protein [Alphaproteobacteria bacterium]